MFTPAGKWEIPEISQCPDQFSLQIWDAAPSFEKQRSILRLCTFMLVLSHWYQGDLNSWKGYSFLETFRRKTKKIFDHWMAGIFCVSRSGTLNWHWTISTEPYSFISSKLIFFKKVNCENEKFERGSGKVIDEMCLFIVTQYI